MGDGDRVEVGITLVRGGLTVSHTYACPYDDGYDISDAVQECVAAVSADPLPVLADALMAQAEADRGDHGGEEDRLIDALYDAAKLYLELKGR